nr:S8 family serine peptidase [Candidatus Brocadiales bacterium]
KKGPPANFKLILRHNPRLTVAIQGDVRSTDGVMQNGHELSNKVLTVAAVNYVEAETRGTALGDPRVIDPTYYTSHGGKAEILFTTGGKRLKEPEVRYKPDLASVDGVNSTFFVASGGDYGFDPDTDIPNFLGTSCSAPHLAGIIALMRQANPELSAAQIRRIARQAATDIHEIGFDYDTGWGLLYADEAIEAAINPPVYNPRYAD